MWRNMRIQYRILRLLLVIPESTFQNMFFFLLSVFFLKDFDLWMVIAVIMDGWMNGLLMDL